MAVRCFASRGLMPVQRKVHRSFSITSVVREGETRAIPTPRQSFKLDYFSSTIQSSPAFARQGITSEGNDAEASNSSTTSNSLISELLTELNDEGRTPSPDRIWSMYYAIHQQVTSAESTSSQPLNALTAREHQSVLRAISRKPKRQKERESTEESLVSYRYRGALLSGSRKAPNHVSSYLQRVLFIFSQLKKADKEHLPSVIDYDTVLERLAPGGNMPALSALWAHITGSNSEDFAVGKDTGVVYNPDATHRPTPRTYMHLMMGISRHLSSQIERIHKQSLSDEIWKGQGKRRIRKADASAKAASKGHAFFGQEVSPQARRAVKLASARTMSLLQHMIHRQLKPEKITLDLAMRILRMDGNIGGIKAMMKAFGVDLENPDGDKSLQDIGEESLRFKIDIHTLNTILMALGEQSTVSEMISTYETLVRPLPLKTLDEGALEEMQGSLFATDWRGIFERNSASITEGLEVNSIVQEEVQDDHILRESVLAVLPNTTTLTVMIKHCCSAPDPARMVANIQQIGSKKSKMIKEDHEAREEGDYLSVACYILSEAIEIQEEETARMAQQIGISLPSIEALCEKVEMILREKEEEAIPSLESNAPLEAQAAAPLARDIFPSTSTTILTDTTTTPNQIDKDTFYAKLIEESKEPSALSLDVSADFVPHFRPPALGVNYQMLQPIVKHLSRRRTSDFARWRWLLMQTQRIIAIKIAELQALCQAIDKWEQIRETANYGPHLNNQGLKSLLSALKKQRRMSQGEVYLLGTNLIDRIMERFSALKVLRRRRQMDRKLRHKEEKKHLLQSQAEEEQKKTRLALQRQQQAEEDQQHQQQQQESQQQSIPIPAVEPVYK